MRFLRKDKVGKTIIIISDLHLGAGVMFNGSRNYLEDFHSDKELVDFLQYYSRGGYLNSAVELIINGDFVDLLAVPFVPFFDDEYWSEEAAIAKLKLIVNAHLEVFKALDEFLSTKEKSIQYILGNHDGELCFPSLQEYLLNQFSEKNRPRFIIRTNEDAGYSPYPGIVLMHGHEYEVAHNFKAAKAIHETAEGKKYFVPPWGSYYVTRVINKFKEERDYINAVRPIKKFLIYGFIYDTLFTVRFLFATCFYFLMVRFLYFFRKGGRDIKKVFMDAAQELELFQDYEELTQEYFTKNPQTIALIVGHTHDPIIRTNSTGNTFINTGTWTKMYNLGFVKSSSDGPLLTYAKINIYHDEKAGLDLALNVWKGTSTLPFQEF